MAWVVRASEEARGRRPTPASARVTAPLSTQIAERHNARRALSSAVATIALAAPWSSALARRQFITVARGARERRRAGDAMARRSATSALRRTRAPRPRRAGRQCPDWRRPDRRTSLPVRDNRRGPRLTAGGAGRTRAAAPAVDGGRGAGAAGCRRGRAGCLFSRSFSRELRALRASLDREAD